MFATANALATNGVRSGDRVGISQPNGPEIIEVAFAVAMLGATLVPISPRLAPDEIRYILRDAGVRTCLVDATADGDVFGGVRLIRTGGSEYSDFLASATSTEPPEIENPDDIALQLYTSGTTGRPKGALLSQRALIQNGLTTLLSQQLHHGDVFLTATPLTHAAAATRIFSLAIDGLTHVILPLYRPDAFLQAIAEHRVTVTMLVPTMLADLLDDPALAKADLSTLHTIVYGAAPISVALVERGVRALPCGLLQGYGLTEGCPALTMLSPDEHRRFAFVDGLRQRLGSIGRPVPGVRVRIVSENGETAQPGHAGELYVRSTKAMLGYWHDADDQDVFADGWLRTGDVVREDNDGYLFLIDRAKNMLISGGLNVYPSEIERVLTSAATVREAAVVGAPDERWGEVPIAFVVGDRGELSDGEIDELIALCHEALAGYKQPKHFVRLPALPRNPTGKVAIPELRELAARAAHGR